MNEMKFADDGSMGACEISTFHQFVRGKSGSGTGSGPLSVAAAAATPSIHTRTIVAGRRSARGQIITVRCIGNGRATRLLAFPQVAARRVHHFVDRPSQFLLVSDRSRTCRSVTITRGLPDLRRLWLEADRG